MMHSSQGGRMRVVGRMPAGIGPGAPPPQPDKSGARHRAHHVSDVLEHAAMHSIGLIPGSCYGHSMHSFSWR